MIVELYINQWQILLILIKTQIFLMDQFQLLKHRFLDQILIHLLNMVYEDIFVLHIFNFLIEKYFV